MTVFLWGDLVFPKLRLHMCDFIAQNASSCESGRAWYSETDWIYLEIEFIVYGKCFVYTQIVWFGLLIEENDAMPLNGPVWGLSRRQSRENGCTP